MTDSIFIKHNSTHKRIKFDEILYLKANGDYVEIWTQHKRYVINHSLKELHKQLHPGKFINIHRSYMVNVEKIKEIENKSRHMLLFVGDTVLRVPTKRKAEVLSKLNIA